MTINRMSPWGDPAADLFQSWPWIDPDEICPHCHAETTYFGCRGPPPSGGGLEPTWSGVLAVREWTSLHEAI
jgi:hypothetical protein